MFHIYLKKIYFFSILLLNSISLIFSAADSITLNKPGCIYIDKVTTSQEIFSFEYIEGYYRAIHANYGIWRNSAVKLKYLGDSTKGVFVNCYISSPNEIVEVINNKYHYHIPCRFIKTKDLYEGNYCVEIVAKLVGDINSESFCQDSYTFQMIKSTNLPGLTVTGFASDQQGCIKTQEKVTLVAKVSNSISKSQGTYKFGITLSNTEVVSKEISLECYIIGGKEVGSYENIICYIPNISPGYYSIYYSVDSSNNSKCPINAINNFNSLNFGGNIKKLKIYQESNSRNIEAKLLNITLDNSSNTIGPFILMFTLDSYQDINTLNYEYFNKKDIGIRLIDKFGSKVNTKCTFVNSGSISNIFNIICTPDSFNTEIQYSIMIEDDIKLGYDTSYIICAYGSTNYYSKIIIPSTEFDVLIIYGEKSYNLDCNYNKYGFTGNYMEHTNYLCGGCSLHCLMCGNKCNKCIEGFELNSSSECNIIKDKINYTNFQDLEKYIPYVNNCNEINRQLFSFKIAYVVKKGENVAFASETNYNLIYAKNEARSYGLKCIVEVNPNYIPSNQLFGNCKEENCSLAAYVNCSFQEKATNSYYNIQVNSNNAFGNLVNKINNLLNSIKIKYIETKIIGTVLEDKIQILYHGLIYYLDDVYVCPSMNSNVSDCNILNFCEKNDYDRKNDETIIYCSKQLYYNVHSCTDYKKIMFEDNCGKLVSEDFTYKYCNDNSARIMFINLIKLLFIFILLI